MSMAQKVNPHGIRCGVINDWESKWYPEEEPDAESIEKENKEISEYLKRLLDTSKELL